MSKHTARNTTESIMKDLNDGFMEGFGYWDRNGKYRANTNEAQTEAAA